MENAAAISGSQIKLARLALKWSQEDLAQRAGVSRRTVTSIENDQGEPLKSSLKSIRRALEGSGVIFVSHKEKIGILYPV